MMDNPTQQSQISENSTAPEKSSVGKRWKKWGLIVIVILIALYGGSYYLTVSRHGFDTQSNLPIPTNIVQPTTAQDETANWEIYKDEELGFEFKYPPGHIGPLSKGYGHSISITYQTQAGKDQESTYQIGVDYISQSQQAVIGISGCSRFTACEDTIIGEATYSLCQENAKGLGRFFNKQCDRARVGIYHPYQGGVITFTVTPAISEYKEILTQLLSTFKFTPSQSSSSIDLIKIFSDLNIENKVKECHYYDNCFSNTFPDSTMRGIARRYILIDANDNKSSIKMGLIFGKSADVTGIGTQYFQNKSVLNLKSDAWYWEIGACPSNNRIFIDAVTGETSPIHKFIYCGGVE